jgi:hypothetical protein
MSTKIRKKKIKARLKLAAKCSGVCMMRLTELAFLPNAMIKRVTVGRDTNSTPVPPAPGSPPGSQRRPKLYAKIAVPICYLHIAT